MQLTFAGSGDAFGSGGRFNTCFHVDRGPSAFLIDCGATSLVALKAHGLEPGNVDTIIISHLHGDHFGGLPFFLLDARLVTKRRRPLTVAGPEGTRERLRQAMEVLFPGSGKVDLGFPLDFVEMPAGSSTDVGDMTVETIEMAHPSGAQSLALRVLCDMRTIVYSGDGEWCDGLVGLAANADLFICECYMYDRPVRFHMDHATIASHAEQLTARRIVLTHMSDTMLANLDAARFEAARDGMVITL